MGPGADAARAAGMDPAALAALLNWWKLAGVESLVGENPVPWLRAAEPDQLTAPAPRAPAPPPRTAAEGWWTSAESLAALTAEVAARHPRAPFADGNAASGLMIMGEAPSAEDLRSGRPFSGPAGIFLDRMLAAIGRDRSSCYIALLCPRRATPGPAAPEDIEQDIALTMAHIRLAAPRHLLLLGANPAQALTGETAPITRLRGNWLSVGGIPALASFNPAYLLRRPEEKALAWADLLALKHRINQ
ncbi:uracil-DNA glycosylase [Sandaracinobacter neustonicus]|uniref:Uracil-DNA glycosylase n=1 Tax=Sandaracinobacter neustonicus TaxID=1715348 RepID=A0A501XIS7_9SPHN|nr:uracil-DNA glycosylase [Sandaracinobacter neustonicus]TPE60194.1 uracil-DNA glycosylase [Sandaracinobacter neustonicus]